MQRIWKGIPLQIAKIYHLLYIVYRFYLVFQVNKMRLNVEKSRFELYTFQLDCAKRNVYEKRDDLIKKLELTRYYLEVLKKEMNEKILLSFFISLPVCFRCCLCYDRIFC